MRVPSNFRKKESWIKKGAPVTLPGSRRGTITSFHESTISECCKDEVYVHSLMVRPEGTTRPQCTNPKDIDRR